MLVDKALAVHSGLVVHGHLRSAAVLLSVQVLLLLLLEVRRSLARVLAPLGSALLTNS